MPQAGNFLDVTIFGREYRVACAPGEKDALQAAVGFVDQRMADIAGSAKSPSPERIAVMAALNIAHEFLLHRETHTEGFDMADARRRIDAMEAKLDSLLAALEAPSDGATAQDELFGH